MAKGASRQVRGPRPRRPSRTGAVPYRRRRMPPPDAGLQRRQTAKQVSHIVNGLAIKDVAERTGLAAQTIRMWEQRYGYPEPRRTPAGYRVYSDADVETLRRVVAFRRRGLSVPAALERARSWGGPSDRPSIYAAIAAAAEPVQTHRLKKRTLLAISHAIEDETLARAAGPIVAAAFQRERNYRAAEHRYRRL